MIVVATDAPLDARNLERLAARAIFALARTGSTYSNGSGDFAIAFSTHPSLRVRPTTDGPQPRTVLPTDGVSGLFEAVLDATEEAVYNSLLESHRHHGQRPHDQRDPDRAARRRCSRSTDDEAAVPSPRSRHSPAGPARRKDASGRASTPSRSTRRSTKPTAGWPRISSRTTSPSSTTARRERSRSSRTTRSRSPSWSCST